MPSKHSLPVRLARAFHTLELQSLEQIAPTVGAVGRLNCTTLCFHRSNGSALFVNSRGRMVEREYTVSEAAWQPHIQISCCKFSQQLVQTSSSTLMLPLELAATTIFDLPLQQTLDTNCWLSSFVSCPVIGSMEPNL